VNFRSHAPDEAHPQNAGPDPARDSQEISNTAESKLTRRAFVTTVGAITGGIMRNKVTVVGGGLVGSIMA
jgi:hypothetical protein